MDLNAAREIVSHLMELHLSEEWTAEYDQSLRHAGTCNGVTRVLTFSLKIAEHVPESEFIDTVVHEIAHALTPGHKHDAVWKRTARSLGGSGERLSSVKLPSEIYSWVGKCSNGVHTFQYQRKPKYVDNGVCKCGKGTKISWTHNGVPYRPATGYIPAPPRTAPRPAPTRTVHTGHGTRATAAPTSFPVSRPRGKWDQGFTDSADLWGGDE